MDHDNLIRAVNRTAARANRRLCEIYDHIGIPCRQRRSNPKKAAAMLKRFAALCRMEAGRRLEADLPAFHRAM